MPLGIERLNARQQPPNSRIIFIKPLPGPSAPTAHDFLSRIAAIAVPIMKAHHLSVMSLEEHEPNAEFVGRNFNAGEVIQLVLRSRSGRWLPVRYVQMVMMHELAHCVQMNHSRAFWAVRNQYAEELRGLWGRSYTGEGMWGRGQSLYDGQYTDSAVPDASDLPEHLCGGTYRSSRGGKRKRKNAGSLTYAERKQRRIAKKFGTNGTALGDDEDARVQLEKGKWVQGKPRVAGSKRGRELRAAAALARFEKEKEDKLKSETEEESETDEESDLDEPAIKQEALDQDGKKLLDSKGRSMVKVCEDEDANHDTDAQNELRELRQITIGEALDRSRKVNRSSPAVKEEDISTESEGEDGSASPAARQSTNGTQAAIHTPPPPPAAASPTTAVTDTLACPICSLINPPETLICAACAHVLDTSELPNHWRCQSAACEGSLYVNPGDAGICGICGAPKDVVDGGGVVVE